MIFEMACYRGTMVWLDGETSKTSWGCGIEADGNTLTSRDLQIGPHRVEAIEVIGPASETGDCDPKAGAFYVFENPLVPKEIELRTANGTWRGPVTKVVIADEDGEETLVRLANGEDYPIDEITLYLRAILQPVS